jgi:hypothetical protein
MRERRKASALRPEAEAPIVELDFEKRLDRECDGLPYRAIPDCRQLQLAGPLSQLQNLHHAMRRSLIFSVSKLIADATELGPEPADGNVAISQTIDARSPAAILLELAIGCIKNGFLGHPGKEVVAIRFCLDTKSRLFGGSLETSDVIAGRANVAIRAGCEPVFRFDATIRARASVQAFTHGFAPCWWNV